MKVQKLIEEVEKSQPRKWVYEFYSRRVKKYVLRGVFALVDASKEEGLKLNGKLLVKLRMLEIRECNSRRRVEYVIETDPENIWRYWGTHSFDIDIYHPETGFTTVCRLESHEDRFLHMQHASKLIWVKQYKRI